MRPRISTAQKVSLEEAGSNAVNIRPRRNNLMLNVNNVNTGIYTYVFDTKLYISRSEISRFDGFEIFYDK